MERKGEGEGGIDGGMKENTEMEERREREMTVREYDENNRGEGK